MKENVSERLEMLRSEMKNRNISAVIIPQADPHMSEYLSEHWQARRWLSGFTGSAGDLVVTLDKALLWTDSRYFLQAGQQLSGSGIVLMKDGLPDTPSITEWLTANLLGGVTVGIDSMVFSTAARAALASALKAHNIALDGDFDVLDKIWSDRPALPKDMALIHDIKYAGLDVTDKFAAVLDGVKKQQADSMFISALDEIAWVLNLRSRDVEYNPVMTSFLYVAPQGATLFVDPDKIDDEVAAYLKARNVAVAPYASVKDFLKSLPAEARVLVNPNGNAAAIVDALGDRAVAGTSPIALLKACKNDVQLAGVRAAMLRDGVAMVKSLYEVQHGVQSGAVLTEMDVADILRRHRSASDLFFDESFGTIAGYGPHGAIVHYEADKESNATLHPQGLLLIDSGAQYLDGTTDITRTISLSGAPTAAEKRDFTLVMKGHIAIATTMFPEGTVGAQLDVLARRALWNEGLSYLHGTGHGVGHFLNVHEGPQSIRLNYVPTPLMPGMITSNEPGLYREGVHGIRCENLVLTTEACTTEFGRFYKFETLTLCPFDRSLFDLSIMTNEEITWLNDYHKRVAEALVPHLEGAELQWLLNNTAALPLHTVTD